MTGCPTCAYQGDPERQYLKGFILLVCAECGVGLGLDRKTDGDSSTLPESQSSSVNETPGTGAYKLSPTGQHSVVTHQMVDSAKVPEATEETSGGVAANLVYLVTDSAELIEEAGRIGTESDAVGMFAGFSTAVEMIEALAHTTRSGDGPDAIIIKGELADFPAQQLAFAIRSLETGVEADKTPLLVVCDDEAAWADRGRGLGSIRAVSLPADLSTEEVCARMIAQLQRLG